MPLGCCWLGWTRSRAAGAVQPFQPEKRLGRNGLVKYGSVKNGLVKNGLVENGMVKNDLHKKPIKAASFKTAWLKSLVENGSVLKCFKPFERANLLYSYSTVYYLFGFPLGR